MKCSLVKMEIIEASRFSRREREREREKGRNEDDDVDVEQQVFSLCLDIVCCIQKL